MNYKKEVSFINIHVSSVGFRKFTNKKSVFLFRISDIFHVRLSPYLFDKT